MTITSHAPAPSAAAAAATPGPDRLTVGVEEEFLLLDPETGVNLAVCERVLAGLPDAVRPHSRLELRRSMLEMVTPVCTELHELRAALTRHRRGAPPAGPGAPGPPAPRRAPPPPHPP